MRSIHLLNLCAVTMGMASMASADVISNTATFTDSPGFYFGPTRSAASILNLAGFDGSLGKLDSVNLYFSAHQVAGVSATFPFPGFWGVKWQTSFNTDLVSSSLPAMTTDCIIGGFSLPPSGQCNRTSDISEMLIASLTAAAELDDFTSNLPLSFSLGLDIVPIDAAGAIFGGVSSYSIDQTTISILRVEYLYTPSVSTVPEPSTAGLSSIAIGIILLCRGHKNFKRSVARTA